MSRSWIMLGAFSLSLCLGCRSTTEGGGPDDGNPGDDDTQLGDDDTGSDDDTGDDDAASDDDNGSVDDDDTVSDDDANDDDTGDDDTGDDDTGGSFDVILDYKVSSLIAPPMHWPMGQGIYAEYTYYYDLPAGAITAPGARLFLLVDWSLNNISWDISFIFYLIQLPTECWLDPFEDVWPVEPLVEGSILDNSDPKQPVVMQTAPMGGAGQLPDDYWEGVNLWDITDVVPADCPGPLSDHYPGVWGGGEVSLYFCGYDPCIRENAIYIGHYGP